jgi:hypothetical protein
VAYIHNGLSFSNKNREISRDRKWIIGYLVLGWGRRGKRKWRMTSLEVREI